MKYRVGGGGAVGGLVRVGEAVSRAPPELREWLDEKLEQVGVDPSPAYARYVLGLLLQPEGEGGEEDGGVDEEEDSKGGAEGRRRRRQGRRQGVGEAPIGYSWPGESPASQRETKVIGSDFGKSRKRSRASSGRYHGVFGDGEFRKRTAAIDCLMSASDQKSGIEKLVDELCVKLKQIQNEAVDGSNFHFELSQVSENPNGNATKCSAQDQAEKYYAAFPPLKKLEDWSTNSSMTMSIDSTCAWSNRKVSSKCIGRNKKNEVWLSNDQMNETQNGENKENVKKKSYGRSFGDNSVWGVSGNGREINNQTGLKDNLGSKFMARHQRVPYFKARRDQGRFCKDFTNENDDLVNGKTDPVRMVLMMALASSAKMWSGSSQRYSLGETELEEPLDFGKQQVRRRLYDLKKNMWENENMMDEKFPPDGESDDKSLASLFAKFDRRMEALWELEPDSELPASFSLLANMPTTHNTSAFNSKASPNYSFILSGTNITSSIWSQCPINNCMTPGICNVDADGKEVIPDSYNGSRVVGSELKKLTIKTGLVTPQLENFRIIWEESTTLFPPQFIGVEKVVSTEPESSASTSVMEEETQEQQPNMEGEGIMLSPLVCYHTVTKESLEALNHSREKSGFTEVTPRVSSKCNSCADISQLKPALPPAVTCPSTQPSKVNSEEDEEVEEDLLTSARTHFLPIRRLSVDSSSGLSESNSGGVHYEDGTTFSIQSALEKVSFYRSESGNLILKEEPDEGEDGSENRNCKTPKKYMIYKGAIGLKGRGFLSDHDNSGFLPKFLVRQNEKSCQTEENDEHCSIGVGVANCCYASITSIEIGAGEEDVEASKGEECEFFFPGDAHLADDLDSMDQGEVEEPKVVSVVEWSQGGPPLGKPLWESTSEGKEEEMSVLSQDSWPKVPSVLCHCSSSAISASTAAEMWEQKECNGQCWNKIWKSSPNAQSCSLQEMDVIPISQIATGTAATGDLEMQSKLLRQELSEESEQLFADLHMVRQMYLGMEWMGPDEEDEENDLDEEIENKSLPCDDIMSARKRNLSGCKKVAENLTQALLDENIIASHEKIKVKKIPYSSCLDYDLMEEIFGPLDPEQMDNLLTTNIPPMAPKGIFFSFELEAEWKKNEKNASMKECHNDHKRRRHSSGRGPRRDLLTHSNQLQIQRRRPCSFFVSDGSCHRSHCRFSHDLSSVPCRFWSDGSCLRGITCPFLHSSAPSVSSGSPSSPLSPPPHRPRKQNYIPIFPTCESTLDDPSMRPITL